jgi:formylglycine-generating enzyme required for sulfatase activity
LNAEKHIFISYAREDRARVAVLARLFEAEGWAVWWDRDNLPAGQQFHRVIDDAINKAACVLVCWSGAAIDSDWVVDEADAARVQGKLLPVMLEETIRLPLAFRRYHAVDLSRWDGQAAHEEYKRLKAELQRRKIPLGGRRGDQDTRMAEAISEPPTAREIASPIDSRAEDGATPGVRALLAELESSATKPERRLKIGDELNDMEGGDPRFGVGLNGDGLPGIDWVAIPAGEFIYGEGSDENKRHLAAFDIARYPITNAQYQAFVDDGGYQDERWWRALKKPEFKPSRWPQGNRPNTDVNWFEATAFARWLSDRLGQTIPLPHETQWERSARGPEGRVYPWGAEYLDGFANVDEKYNKDGPYYLEQTTAAGVYAHAKTPEGLLDLSGNVWEWCRNDYGKPDKDIDVPGSPVLRGGSWYYDPRDARAAYRGRDDPDLRDGSIGFRLLRSPPS